MRISFTKFYPLWALAPVIAEGDLMEDWSCSYNFINSKGNSYCYPDRGGAGQAIQSPRLLNRNLLPEELAFLDDGRRGIIYIICSILYPVLYVGITRGSLRKGVFGSGRLVHHIRKLFACHAPQTSHTEGWREHAIARYGDRLAAKLNTTKGQDINWCGTLIGEDLVFAVGSIENNNDPTLIEGTILDAVEAGFASFNCAVNIMNKGKIKREQALIDLPSNLSFIANELQKPQRADRIGSATSFKVIEIPLSIDSIAKYCRTRRGVNQCACDRLTSCLAGSFPTFWEAQWRAKLFEAASEWRSIDFGISFAITAARKGGHLKKRTIKEFNEILDVYVKATKIMLQDTDEGSKWRCLEIESIRAGLWKV